MAETKIAIKKLRPNPFQPLTRVNVTDEDAKEFGLSILEHGMILTPVGRPADTPGFYEVGDGWLRVKGHEWLVNNGHPEFKELRFDIRELNDQQMADLVLEANKVRKDLNPIEEAQFYKRYLESFKVTQEELAKKHNVSQGEIANTLRLLELPEDIQAKVISREISSTHARQLLRLNVAPETQAKFLESTIKHGMSVSQLDNEINRTLWQGSKPLSLSQYDRILFDVKGCDGCQTTAMVADPWGDQKKQLRCLNVDCWEKKEAAAEKAKEAAAEKRLKKKAGKEKILTGKDLRYDQYHSLDSYKKEVDNPEQCDTCEKRALYSYDLKNDRKPERVCLDPKCYRVKQTKRTKETNKEKKQLDKALTARLGAIFEKTSKNRYGCLVLATRRAIQHLSASARDDIASMFPNLPKHSNGRLDPDVLRAKIYGMTEPEIVKLLAAIVVSEGRRHQSWDFSTELKDEQLMDIAIMEGTYEAKVAEVIAFQEANCKGCGNANQALVSTGEPCCTYTYNRKIINGVCENSPEMREQRKKKGEKPTVADMVDSTASDNTGEAELVEAG